MCTARPRPAASSRRSATPTALTALCVLIGDPPIEVATAGELADLLAQVPADTPLLIDEHLRIDPEFDEGTTESRKAVQATAVSAFADEPVMAVDEHGGRDVYSYRVAALILGGVVVAQGAPAPALSVAYGAGRAHAPSRS